MEKIKIITDSTCDLPQELVDKLNIEVIPLIVNLGDDSFFDREEIRLPRLLEYMKAAEDLPTTSQITPNRFIEIYKKYLGEGYKIFSIHLSSCMSGTYNSACVAKDLLETDDIVVLDSQNVTTGLGILVLKACSLRDKDATLNEIEKIIKEDIPHVKSALIFESLDNLVKGGRLSKTAGMIGNMLSIKLILCIKDGEMAVLDKVRGSKKAFKYVFDYLENTGFKKDDPFILLEADGQDLKEAIEEELESRHIDFINADVGCVVGVHSGPRASGIFYIEEY